MSSKFIYSQKSSIIDASRGTKYTSFNFNLEIFYSIYFTSKTKALLSKAVEHAQLTKFQNFSEKKLSSVSKCP